MTKQHDSRNRRPIGQLALAAIALGISACASVPDRAKLSDRSAVPSQWGYGNPAEVELFSSLAGLVEDPMVQALIERAVDQNLSLKQSELTLRESSILLRGKWSERLPRVDGVSSVRRGNESGKAATDVNAGFELRWELDLWGRLADEFASEKARVASLEADYRAARNSLAARVVQLTIDRIFREQALELDLRREASLRKNVDVIRARYLRGLIAIVDWDTAASSLATTSAVVAQRREDIRVTDRAISELLGDFSFSSAALPDSLPSVHAPSAPIPATVLAQRVDVASALERVVGQSHSVSGIRKRMLPTFDLTASWSVNGPTVSELLKADPVSFILGSITVPIFNAGKIRADTKAAEVALERTQVAYREVLLRAIVEVDDALGRELSLASQVSHLERSAEHARQSFSTFEDQYRRGLVDVLDFLTAQRSAFDAELRLLETRAAILRNRMQLGLAIGLQVPR